MAATRKPRKPRTFLLPAKKGRLVVVYGGRDAEPWLACLTNDVGTTDKTVELEPYLAGSICGTPVPTVKRPAGHVYLEFLPAWEAAKDAAERDLVKAEAALLAAVRRRDLATRVVEASRQAAQAK